MGFDLQIDGMSVQWKDQPPRGDGWGMAFAANHNRMGNEGGCEWLISKNYCKELKNKRNNPRAATTRRNSGCLTCGCAEISIAALLFTSFVLWNTSLLGLGSYLFISSARQLQCSDWEAEMLTMRCLLPRKEVFAFIFAFLFWIQKTNNPLHGPTESCLP